MKNLFLFSLLFLLAGLYNKSYAQNSRDSLQTKKVVYCEIVGNQRFLSTKFDISIDYGEERGFFEDTRLRDEQSGKVQKFNSMVDALNYMCNNGWEFVDSYIVQIDKLNYFHWLLKKK